MSNTVTYKEIRRIKLERHKGEYGGERTKGLFRDARLKDVKRGVEVAF